MPSVAYGTSTYLRTNGNFPPLTLINMFLEQAKTSEQQIALLSRPGLVESYAVGDGPVNAVFSKKGCSAATCSPSPGTALSRRNADRHDYGDWPGFDRRLG
jgi:hypothetical protein